MPLVKILLYAALALIVIAVMVLTIIHNPGDTALINLVAFIVVGAVIAYFAFLYSKKQ